MDQRERILAFENLADAIPVVGRMFNIHQIFSLEVNSIRWIQVKGKPGIAPFEMNCVSSEPLELLRLT